MAEPRPLRACPEIVAAAIAWVVSSALLLAMFPPEPTYPPADLWTAVKLIFILSVLGAVVYLISSWWVREEFVRIPRACLSAASLVVIGGSVLFALEGLLGLPEPIVRGVEIPGINLGLGLLGIALSKALRNAAGPAPSWGVSPGVLAGFAHSAASVVILGLYSYMSGGVEARPVNVWVLAETSSHAFGSAALAVSSIYSADAESRLSGRPRVAAAMIVTAMSLGSSSCAWAILTDVLEVGWAYYPLVIAPAWAAGVLFIAGLLLLGRVGPIGGAVSAGPTACLMHATPRARADAARRALERFGAGREVLALGPPSSPLASICRLTPTFRSEPRAGGVRLDPSFLRGAIRRAKSEGRPLLILFDSANDLINLVGVREAYRLLRLMVEELGPRDVMVVLADMTSLSEEERATLLLLLSICG
ncbi:MAG: hypothetical protein DRO06_03495 [Thermoproteota archaeon]|nr:MAG: hypothetical protein DRO06_03495 [Candidatus Korarchaeota archaeon]